jgi:hypothetical protein
MYVMPVPKNVSITTLSTASNAHKHAAAALKNVEEWLDRLGKSHHLLFSFPKLFELFYYIAMIII